MSCMTCDFAGVEHGDMPCAVCECFELWQEKSGSLKVATNREPDTSIIHNRKDSSTDENVKGLECSDRCPECSSDCLVRIFCGGENK